MVYVGVTARYVVNIEALNMAESVGNIVRHKKAPIVVKTDGGYVLRYVPVVSGQSIAHGYQELLASVAGKLGLPVCPLCAEGILVKHGADEIIKRLADVYKAPHATRLLQLVDAVKPKGRGKKQAALDPARFIEEFERTVIENCVVEDVGGFLYPGAVPVKRTSRFYAGYMAPAAGHIAAVGMEAQMHVRHDPKSVTGRAGEETGQAIYQVETASALYTVTLALDLDGIGCYTRAEGGWGELGDAAKRREAALRALAMLVEGMLWGAKKTRFLPHAEPESLAVLVVHPFPLNPRPGHYDDYIKATIDSARAFLEAARGAAGDAFAELYYYTSDKSAAREPESRGGDGVHVERAPSPSAAVLSALKHLEKASCAH